MRSPCVGEFLGTSIEMHCNTMLEYLCLYESVWPPVLGWLSVLQTGADLRIVGSVDWGITQHPALFTYLNLKLNISKTSIKHFSSVLKISIFNCLISVSARPTNERRRRWETPPLLRAAERLRLHPTKWQRNLKSIIEKREEALQFNRFPIECAHSWGSRATDRISFNQF